ncbi:ATP synthase subunit B [soil metagenome]
MTVDWFTVCAQAINFLILVWLMKRFLYKPILAAIDARDKKIADELADAASKKSEAKTERDTFQRKNDEFDKQRSELLAKAVDAANAERQSMLVEARKEADRLRLQRQELLINDASSLKQAITRLTRQAVFDIARKTLTDLAGTNLEERISEVFTQKLRAITSPDKEVLAEGLKSATEPALVCSAVELSGEQRQAIQKALNETFSMDVHLKFKTTPDLIGGIELSANGHNISWTISEYLRSMENDVGELIKKRFASEADDGTKPAPSSNHNPAQPAPTPDPTTAPIPVSTPDPTTAPIPVSTPAPAKNPTVESKAPVQEVSK